VHNRQRLINFVIYSEMYINICLPICSGSIVALGDALSVFKDSIVLEAGDSRITVRRARLLSSTFDSMKHGSFSCNKNLRVEFSGEGAVDVGGPRREFFRYVKCVKYYCKYFSPYF